MKKEKNHFAYKNIQLKIFRENELTHLNKLKLNSLLIPLLRDKKLRELQKNGELMYQFFQQLINIKNELCTFLEKELLVVEMEHIRAISHYYEIFCEVIETFQQRALHIYNQFSNQMEYSNEKFANRYKVMYENYYEDIQNSNDTKIKEEKEYEKKQKELEEKYEILKSETKKQGINYKQEIKVALEPTQEKLWQLILESYQSYHNSTLEQRILYENLTKKDKNYIESIKANRQSIATEKENITELRLKIENIKQYQYEQLYQVQKKNREIQEYSINKTKQLSRNMKRKKEAIKRFVSETDEILKKLKALINKAEKIIVIKELYSTLELTDENIPPYKNFSEENINTNENEERKIAT